jgi:hypothetical protein
MTHAFAGCGSEGMPMAAVAPRGSKTPPNCDRRRPSPKRKALKMCEVNFSCESIKQAFRSAGFFAELLNGRGPVNALECRGARRHAAWHPSLKIEDNSKMEDRVARNGRENRDSFTALIHVVQAIVSY